ncbi:MAG: acetylornithine deacetylase [Acidobacteriota bacterium]
MSPLETKPPLSDDQLLARLVGFDTTSYRSNLELVDFLCDYLDRPEIQLQRQPSPDGTKANLVAFVGPPVDETERRGLVLSGHMDVVPATEPEWTSDPFTLTEGDDRWVGRGSADMKGFVALAANRAWALAEQLRAGREPAHPLALIFTYDEEVGTLGAHHFRHHWPEDRPLPRSAVIGEPTWMRVVRLHKGHLRLRVELRGVPAHSGYPHLGIHAIEPLGPILQSLIQLRRQLEERRPTNHEFFPQVPYPALNVGTVDGGSAVNVVPDRCTVEIGARALPGMDPEELATEIRRAVEDGFARAGSRAQLRVETLNDSPPLETSAKAPICRCLATLTGQQETISASYATDAGWLRQLEMDCVVWGPGSIEVAHKANEFIPKDQLLAGGDQLDQLLQRLVLDPQPTETSR